MQNRGFKPSVNMVSYRTVYNEVEAIKAYLRKFKPNSNVEIDENMIREMISEHLPITQMMYCRIGSVN